MARCNANTKAGNRCQNKATRSGRCRVHQRGGRSSITSQSSRRSRTTRAPTGSPTVVKTTAGRAVTLDHARVRNELVSFVDRRKGQVATRLMVMPKGQQVIAYGYHKLDTRVLKHVASIGAREAAEKVAYVALRVGFKAVPVIGWASLAYDAYQLGKVVHDEYLDEDAVSLRRARQ